MGNAAAADVPSVELPKSGCVRTIRPRKNLDLVSTKVGLSTGNEMK